MAAIMTQMVTKVWVCHLVYPIRSTIRPIQNEPQIQVIVKFLRFVKTAPGYVAGNYGYVPEEPSTLVVFLQFNVSVENVHAWFEKLKYPHKSSAADLGPKNE